MTPSSSICASRTALILGHIYDAALDFNKWRHALAEIRAVLGANNVILILRPGTARSPGLSLVFREDLYEYADPFSNSEFLSPFETIAAGEVTTIADLLSDEQWRATPFYRRHCEPADVYDVMLLDLRSRDGSTYRIRITRPEQAARFGREDKEFLALLAPHFRRAIEMQTTFERTELLHAQYVEVCDRMGVATFILDTKGNVLQHNKSACELVGGLDGLAIVPSMIAAGCFAFIAYLAGNAIFANYLQIHHVTGAGELTVFCGAMVGASLGFLWFNAPPAMVFMGDTGSLSIGAALGTISVITKHELVLAIVGGLFVLEAVSVIVQVASFRITGRRVFRMAPLHHHFEQKGWEEATIVIRFWIIAWILAIAGLATLKLR